MKQTYKTNKKTERSRFTRMCIGESIIELMQEQALCEIPISAVAKKAGISRMTFYYYYDSLTSALTDYMQEIVFAFLKERKSSSEYKDYPEYSHLLFSLHFFDRYENFFLTMTKNGLHSILMNGINEFMLAFFPHRAHQSLYDIYFYAGGLLNIFLKWEENGKKESAEEIAKIIYAHTLFPTN